MAAGRAGRGRIVRARRRRVGVEGLRGSRGQGVKAREEEGRGKALADKPPVAPGGVSHGTGTVGVLDQVGMVEWAV